jgi:hypothetical protein
MRFAYASGFGWLLRIDAALCAVDQQRAKTMATIRPEITGRGVDTAIPGTGEIGGNRAQPSDCIQPSWIELQRVVDLKEASRLAGLSVDTIKRHHSDKIIDLSPRRRGMRVGDALMLARPP